MSSTRSDPLDIQFGDVNQAIGARHDFDKRAEIGDTTDEAVVHFADFGFFDDRLDACHCGLGRHRRIDRGDEHGAVIGDVDLSAGLFDDATDDLAAGANHLADLRRIDLQDDNPRSVIGELFAMFGNRGVHIIENLQSSDCAPCRAPVRIVSISRPVILISIWMEVTPAGGAGDLEVHIAEMIFIAEDVGQDDDFVVSLIRPIAIPATAVLIGTPASISASEAAADGRHRRGTVGFQDIGRRRERCTGSSSSAGITGKSARSARAP